MNSETDKHKSEKERQIHAILNLSQHKSFADSIKLSPKRDSHLMDVSIDSARVKRLINWSRIGSLTAITIFILNLFVIRKPISISIFQQVSLFGLILILFGGPLSKYTGTMWSWGRVGTRITEPSPSFLVKFIGWILLLAPIVYELLSTN